MIERDLRIVEKELNAKRSQGHFQYLESMRSRVAAMETEELNHQLGGRFRKRPSLFEEADVEHRIFPGRMAPVVTGFINPSNEQYSIERKVLPMRYRVRPWGSSEEIPTRFNVFNARLDSLRSRKTWKGLIERQHGVVLIRKFYEWVEKDGRSLVAFSSQNFDYLQVPVLFEKWQSADRNIRFFSFAIITDEPTPEIAAAGHDRRPIALSAEGVTRWLEGPFLQTAGGPPRPGRSDQDAVEILKSYQTDDFYQVEEVRN